VVLRPSKGCRGRSPSAAREPLNFLLCVNRRDALIGALTHCSTIIYPFSPDLPVPAIVAEAEAFARHRHKIEQIAAAENIDARNGHRKNRQGHDRG
jgi:hypothetical protein